MTATVARLLSLVAGAANLLVLAALALLVALRMPGNHWGLDHRLLLAVPAATLLWLVVAVAVLRVRLGRPWLAALAAALLCAAAILALDHWNLLVEYETWLRRGMPAFGEVG